MKSCSQIRPLLPSWADGSLSTEFRARVEAHLRVCSPCRELGNALRGALADLSRTPADDAELTASILASTTGDSCRSCRLRLSAWAEGELPPKEGQLVGEHLRHCSSCREVLEVMRWLPAVLPTLRDAPADERFTRGVLARTSHSTANSAEGFAVGTSKAGFFDRLRERGRRWAVRPLFPVEAAYVATLIAVLILGPATVASLPPHAAAWVRGEGQGLLAAGTLFFPVGGEEGEIAGHGSGPLTARIVAARVSAGRAIGAHARDGWHAAREIARELNAVAAAVQERGQREVGPALARLGESFDRLWNHGSPERESQDFREGEEQR